MKLFMVCSINNKKNRKGNNMKNTRAIILAIIYMLGISSIVVARDTVIPCGWFGKSKLIQTGEAYNCVCEGWFSICNDGVIPD